VTDSGESAVLVEQPGFLTGTKSLFQGMAWLAKNPSAWPLAMVPMVIAMVITLALSYASFRFVPGWIGGAIGAGGGTLAKVGAGVLKVLATALAVMLSSLVAFALAQPLSGAALEALVRRQEADMGLPPRPETNFIADVLRSLQSLAIGYGFGLPMIAMLFGLSILLPFASVILFPLKIFVAACAIAWDICDYPMTIRGLRVSDRVALLMRNKKAVFGFALGLALAALVPCVLFLFLPGGVCGAARLIATIETWEESQGRARLQSPNAPAAMSA
jgi:CysZ protein